MSEKSTAARAAPAKKIAASAPAKRATKRAPAAPAATPVKTKGKGKAAPIPLEDDFEAEIEDLTAEDGAEATAPAETAGRASRSSRCG
jgi:hypothetical protein